MTIERMQKIKNLLKSNKKVYVNDLCDQFNVSAVTIRKDLTRLESEGWAVKVYGGAVLSSSFELMDKPQPWYQDPVRLALAERACLEIADGDSIFLGSGRTCCVLAMLLSRFQNLSVITNNITALSDLLAAGCRVNLIGGEVTCIDDQTLFSSQNREDILQGKLSVDKAFTSIYGLDRKAGLTVNSIISTSIFQAIPHFARRWHLMAEKSKFGRIGLYPIAQLSDTYALITDKMDHEWTQSLTEHHPSLKIMLPEKKDQSI